MRWQVYDGLHKSCRERIAVHCVGRFQLTGGDDGSLRGQEEGGTNSKREERVVVGKCRFDLKKDLECSDRQCSVEWSCCLSRQHSQLAS